MADGGMTKWQDGDRRVSQFAYGPTEALLDEAFKGNRNLAARDERFALAPVRTALVFFAATRAAYGAGFCLQMAASTVVAFNVGTGGALDATNGGATGTATDAESMAGNQGGIVRNGATFVAVGARYAYEGAWYATDAANQLGNRQRPAWFGDASFNYPQALREQVEPAMSSYLELFGGSKQKCEERLGPIKRWMSDDKGSAAPLGNFVAFTDPYGSGGEKTAQMLKLTVEQPRTVQVEEVPGLTLPAAGSVLLAYSFTVWGYPVCGDPTGDVCDTDSQTNARISALETGQRRLEDGVNNIVASLNNLVARLPAGR